MVTSSTQAVEIGLSPVRKGVLFILCLSLSIPPIIVFPLLPVVPIWVATTGGLWLIGTLMAISLGRPLWNALVAIQAAAIALYAGSYIIENGGHVAALRRPMLDIGPAAALLFATLLAIFVTVSALRFLRQRQHLATSFISVALSIGVALVVLVSCAILGRAALVYSRPESVLARARFDRAIRLHYRHWNSAWAWRFPSQAAERDPFRHWYVRGRVVFLRRRMEGNVNRRGDPSIPRDNDPYLRRLSLELLDSDLRAETEEQLDEVGTVVFVDSYETSTARYTNGSFAIVGVIHFVVVDIVEQRATYIGYIEGGSAPESIRVRRGAPPGRVDGPSAPPLDVVAATVAGMPRIAYASPARQTMEFR